MGLATGGNRARERAGADPEVAEVVAFWRRVVDDGLWMAKDPEFDRDFRDRFLSLHMAATARRRDDWIETADGALALMVLLDQFPRNAFRDTAHMYASDGLARMFAGEARQRGHMLQVDEGFRVFFVFPFTHSEEIADQPGEHGVPAHLGERQMKLAVVIDGGAAFNDFRLHAGEFLLLKGPNGVGKSTLLRTIYRSYLPQAGRVTFHSRRGPIDLARAADVGDVPCHCWL